ncbi:MAG: SCO1664 family protein [Streptosporangiales bacterium]|nr:SCO1664 family protein [Streptosporangiales bacterium]
MTEHPAASAVPEDPLRLLRHGELELVGRLVDASNATFYCQVELDGVEATCVYKPVKGERRLWDFPTGTLADREVAAYTVSEATGWRIVPPTVARREGPFGPGMCQLWIDADEGVDLVGLIRGGSGELRRMAVFDAVINNADRKGGHLLPVSDGHVYGVDHGVCFSVDDKLRTVLWQWAGDPLPDEAVRTLDQLARQLVRGGELAVRLGSLLSAEEVGRTRARVQRLLAAGTHPEPSDDWPAVPWPPF